jgi:type IV pilus assembly protein PilM
MSIFNIKKAFKDHFPPPQYLRMPSVGFHISNQTVRFIELARKSGRIEALRYGERKIPEGLIYSENAAKDETLKAALSNIKREEHLTFINVSLPEDKAYLFKITVPRVDPRELRGVVELQLEENVPFKAEEVVFDYTILKQNEPSDFYDLSVSAFPKDFIQNFTELFESVGLVPVTFEISAEAAASALVRKGDLGTYMIVNFGERNTGIYIVSRGSVLFTSSLNFGGDALTSGIEKHFGITREKALEIKKGKNVSYDKSSMQLFYSLMNPISALRDEVNRVSNYWRTHKDRSGRVGDPITKILLCGSDCNLLHLDEYLSLSMSMSVEIGNVWTNVVSLDEYIPPLTFAESLDYAAAIGLALRSHI